MTKEIMKPMSDEVAAQLNESYPVDPSALRIQLPRLGMVSQDVTEEVKNPKNGKKEIKIITEAGVFFTEHQSEELDENGKKIWKKTEIGTSIDAIVVYKRKQLRFYESATQLYTSSPIFDTEDEIIPLWKDKTEVDRGLPSELRKREQYQGKTAAGKATSKLEDNYILYVMYEGQMYQMTLRGTSMYAFKAYEKTTKPNMVITQFGSEPKENGTTRWNQTTFAVVRPLNGDEAEEVLSKVKEIVTAISIEKASYAAANDSKEAGNRAFDQSAAEFKEAAVKKEVKTGQIVNPKKKGF